LIHEIGVILLKEGTVPPKNSGKELRFLEGIPLHHFPGQEGSQEVRQHGLPKIKFLLEQPPISPITSRRASLSNNSNFSKGKECAPGASSSRPNPPALSAGRDVLPPGSLFFVEGVWITRWRLARSGFTKRVRLCRSSSPRGGGPTGAAERMWITSSFFASFFPFFGTFSRGFFFSL